MLIKSLVVAAALLGLAGCQNISSTATDIESQNIALLGTWNIEVIGANPVIDYSPAELTFGKDGQLTGNNSCNSFFGGYTQTGNDITLDAAGVSMKACVDALMMQEQNVMQLMPTIVSGKLTKGKLLLQDAAGNTQLVLSRR